MYRRLNNFIFVKRNPVLRTYQAVLWYISVMVWHAFFILFYLSENFLTRNIENCASFLFSIICSNSAFPAIAFLNISTVLTRDFYVVYFLGTSVIDWFLFYSIGSPIFQNKWFFLFLPRRRNISSFLWSALVFSKNIWIRPFGVCMKAKYSMSNPFLRSSLIGSERILPFWGAE